MDRKKLWLISIVTILLITTSGAFVYSETESVSTLSGLKAIHVRVAPSDSKIGEEVLTANQLYADIESEFSKAGVKMLSEKEFERLKKSQRYPLAILDVSTNLMEIEGLNLIIYNIIVQLRQSVLLLRKPVLKIFAPTWEKREIANISSVDALRDRVKAIVNLFIGDYLSENPK